MANDPAAQGVEIRCYPSEGGFSIWIEAAVGTGYWIEYYVLGAGGYRESGEVTGAIAMRPEILRRPVAVPVIEAGVIAMSFGKPRDLRARQLESRRPSVLDRRPIPDGEVEVGAKDEGTAPQPDLE
jgi:hypothetical protein